MRRISRVRSLCAALREGCWPTSPARLRNERASSLVVLVAVRGIQLPQCQGEQRICGVRGAELIEETGLDGMRSYVTLPSLCISGREEGDDVMNEVSLQCQSRTLRKTDYGLGPGP